VLNVKQISHGGSALKKIDKKEISGLIVLFVGVILLAFTFFSAYGFLVGKLSILASADLTELFGRALAPLIEAIIRILYLGVMGWVGSILTIRAIQMLKLEKEPTQTQPQVKPETKQSTVSSSSPAKTEQKTEIKEATKVENPANPEKTPTPAQPVAPQEEVKAK